jgi:transcriptional regulator of acetoin/glycerol metabolism
MHTNDHELFMHLLNRFTLDYLRCLKDLFGSKRMSMNWLFKTAIEFKFDELLKESNHNLSRCARKLGISQKTLYRKMHKKRKGGK